MSFQETEVLKKMLGMFNQLQPPKYLNKEKKIEIFNQRMKKYKYK